MNGWSSFVEKDEWPYLAGSPFFIVFMISIKSMRDERLQKLLIKMDNKGHIGKISVYNDNWILNLIDF